jgi:hypothetical protein
VKSSFRPPVGSTPWHETAQDDTKLFSPDFPIDYKVPSYGADPDIAGTKKHIEYAEGKLKHKLSKSYLYPTPEAAVPDLRLPNFGNYDRDI